MWLWALLAVAAATATTSTTWAIPIHDADSERDSTSSRKILGSSVVTSVSVIMDAGGSETPHFSDAVGRPVARPASASQVASPINLLNPDRYEFYTFDDNGDLVRRLMTLEEIQGIIANGDGEAAINSAQQAQYEPEKKVNDVVNNVQNVLKEEMETHRNNTDNGKQPVLDTPDVSATWSMILPAIFGNSGEDIHLDQQQVQHTPETIVLDTTTPKATTTTTTTTTRKPQQELINQVQTERNPQSPITSIVNVDTPVITVAIVARQPEHHRDDEQNDDNASSTTVNEDSTNKFLQLFRPSTQPQFPSTVAASQPSSEAPNKYLAVFLPQDNRLEETKNNQVTTKKRQPIIKPTTFRPIFKDEIVRKPSPFRPTKLSTTTPAGVILNRKPSPSPINALPSTLADFIRQKISTVAHSPSTIGPVRRPIPTLGAQFVVDDKFKTSTKRVAISTTRAPLPRLTTTTSTTAKPTTTTTPSTTSSRRTTTRTTTTTTTTTTTPKPTTTTTTTTTTTEPPTTIRTTKEPSLVRIPISSTTEELHTSSSNFYTQKPSTSNHVTNKYTATTSQIIDSINEKVQAVSAALLNKIIDTTAQEDTTEQLLSTNPDLYTTLQDSDEPEVKVTVPQRIDNLLLTSTNIYQINNAVEGTTKVIARPLRVTTTELATTTEPVTESLPMSTEPNLIASIEELISQTINDPTNEIIDNKRETQKVTEQHTTTDEPLAITVAMDKIEERPDQFDILNESVGSLLSQVFNSDKQTLTTLEDFATSTEDFRRTVPDISDGTTVTIPTTTEELSTTQNSIYTTNSAFETEVSTENIAASTFEPTTITALDDKDKNEILKTESSSYFVPSTKEQTIGDLLKTTVIADITTIEPQTTAVEEEVLYTSQPSVDDTTTIESVKSTTETIIPTTYRPVTTQSSKNPNVSRHPTLKYETKVIRSTEKTTATSSNATQTSEWKLVPTLAPNSNVTLATTSTRPAAEVASPKPVELVPQPMVGFSLEDTTSKLDPDIKQFVVLCNELAFGFWNSVTTGISQARSVFVSPFAATSLLAMVFLGARGATSGEMNEILKLDDMVTFNPHLIFRNITESVEASEKEGIATSVIARELYSDKSKGPLLNFYKERAKAFYDGHVEDASFKEIGDVIRRRTNLLVKRQTQGRIPEYVKDSSFTVRPPLAGVSVSIFQTDCTAASTEGRDGELYFVVLPTIRQRRLIPVPAVVWRSGFLAGYEPNLDATAVSIGTADQTVSTIFVIPGQQGIAAPGDGLARLERHLIDSAFRQGMWARLLRSLIPRPGLEVQIPRFAHRSVINATVALQHMGLKDLFDADKADLRGLNGVANELYLSDIIQLNNFATCGEGVIGDQHHSEIYPATANRTFRRYRGFRIDTSSEETLDEDPEDVGVESRYFRAEPLLEKEYAELLAEEPRDYQRAFHDPLHDPSLLALPLSLRPRQARIPEAPRLRFDRPFLYFVRHNPTGLVLHMGRFNPRLLP